MANDDYMDIFVEESREHLQALNEGMLGLERAPGDSNIINSIFRSAHTLKGMAGAMNFDHMAHLTHDMESSLDKVRSGELVVDERVIEALFESVDVLQHQLEQIVTTGSDEGVDVEHAVALIRAISSEDHALSAQPDPAVSLETGQTDTRGAVAGMSVADAGRRAYEVEVTVDPQCQMPSVRGFMVKRAYEQVGEILACDPPNPSSDDFKGFLKLVVASELDKQALHDLGVEIMEIARVHVTELNLQESSTAQRLSAIGARGSSSTRNQTKYVRVDVERLDALMNLYSEFVIDKTRLEQISSTSTVQGLDETVQHLARVGTDLQDMIMKIRMIPLETVFNRFPRMIRDLSKALGKKADLQIFGAETEIDRVLADEIADPIVHILRNSMDHGLEAPEERVASGKNEVGAVKISAYHAGNHVFIEIEDDGRGIDRDRVLKKAVSQRLISQSDAQGASDEQVFDFLFHSGFSTADKVSDISGRGVGLDAVRAKIRELSGNVSVKTVQGRGTTFVIQLPLTVSILSAILVQASDEIYAVPTNAILHMDILDESSVSVWQGRPMYNYRGSFVPLTFLAEVLGVPSADAHRGDHVAILGVGGNLIAIAVEGFVGQQEVVLKSLGAYLRGTTKAISGATILGDGKVALILDPHHIVD